MTYNRLENSRLFWIHKYEPSSDPNSAIDAISELLYEAHFKRNEALTKKHLWLLIKDLAINWLQSDTQYLAIGLNKNAYSPGQIYHRLEFKYNPISKLIELMESNQLIELHRGFRDRINGIGYVSRFRAAPNLIDLFESFGVKDDIDRVYPISRPLDPIEIRDEDKRPTNFVPTLQIKTIVDEVARYNEALENIHIDASLDGYRYPVKIDLAKKFVRRIFNNNTIEQGGRLSGAWWLDCPSEVRSRILLGHLETFEYDLKALHPILLYSEQGIDYFAEIGSDPYTACDVGAVLNRPLRDAEHIVFRNVFKQIFLVLINNINEETAKAAYWNEARKANQKARKERGFLPYPERMPPEQLYLLWDKFKEAHSAIGHRFAGSGNSTPASMRLMRIDSDYIMRVLMRMLDKKATCLSVHDSLIVPLPYQELAIQVLQEVFQEILLENNMKPIDAKTSQDAFFRLFTPYAKESFIQDKALRERSLLKRPRYINYHPNTSS
jgi:hypothetical protein